MLKQIRLYVLALLSLLLVSVSEKVVFYFYYHSALSSLSFGETLYAFIFGLRFDIALAATLAYVAYIGAYLLYRLLRVRFSTGIQILTYLAMTVLLFIHGADLLYFGESGRHLGYELMQGYNSRDALTATALHCYPAPVAGQLLLLLPALLYISRRLFRRWSPQPDSGTSRPGFWRKLHAEGQLLLLLPIVVILGRGGLQHVPLEPLWAQEIGNTDAATLALNGAYNAIFSSITPYSIKPVIDKKPDAKQLAILRALYPRDPHLQQVSENIPPKDRPNVVMFFLESWSAHYMSTYGYDKPTTPNFTRLRNAGFSVKGMMAGGHRTTEGLYSALCSAQNPLGKSVAQTQLQNYHYDCLPKILDKAGYHTAFFQGTRVNTSGTGAFAQMLGFHQSYGKADVKKREYPENGWGVQDPDLYRFILKKLNKMPQPFLIGINNATTHDNVLPPGMKAPYTTANDTDKYLNVLQFSDKSLGEFIHALYSDPKLKNTIVVLESDHCGFASTPQINNYFISFAIYGPGLIKHGYRNIVASQRDVAPTVLDLLHMKPAPWFEGKSLLRDDPNHFASYYYPGVQGWVQNNRVVEFPILQPNQLHCFSYDAKNTPLACTAADKARRNRALAFSTLSQWLLFKGKTTDFGKILGRTKPALSANVQKASATQ